VKKGDAGTRGIRPNSNSSAEELVRPAQPHRNTGAGQDGASRLTVDGRLIVSAKHASLNPERSVAFWSRQAKVLVQARLETSPQLLQATVEFASVYAKHRFHARMAEKVALASHELIENAIAYGSVAADIVYTLGKLDECIEVCVTNSSSFARVNNLRSHLERLRVDPEKVYREEMARSMSGAGARAALGLARICYESQMDIGLNVEGSQVTLRAWSWR
jgi:hypothetical protein